MFASHGIIQSINRVNIVTDGLVLNLDAGNAASYPGSGTSWTDLSGNGNNGTLTNGPTYDSANGGSIEFDGVDDYVSVGSSNSLKITSGTMCFWVYLTSGGVTFQQIGGKRFAGTVSGIDYMLDLSSTGQNIRGIISDGSALNLITGSTTLNYSNWYYVSFTWNGTKLNLYVNSVVDATEVSQTITPQTSDRSFDLAVAQDPGVGSRYFLGNISVAHVYNRALSASEIEKNFNALKSRYGL